jgi:hypothetical protein
LDRLAKNPILTKELLREAVDFFKFSFDVDNICGADIQAFGEDGVEIDDADIGSVVEELQLDLQRVLAGLQAELAALTQYQDLDTVTLGKIDVARLARMETDMQTKIDIAYHGDSDDEAQKKCYGLEIEKVKKLKDCVSQTLKLRTSTLDRQERLQEKRQSTPKRQKLESHVELSPLTGDFSLQTSPVAPLCSSLVSGSGVSVLPFVFDDFISFQDAISTMSDSASVIVRLGKVPREPREGKTTRGQPYKMIKVDMYQPAPQPLAHVLIWTKYADSWLPRLLKCEDSVVRIRNLKYEFNLKSSEHQFEVQQNSTLELDDLSEEVINSFRHYETIEKKFTDLPKMEHYARANFKGFFKSFDAVASGPSKEGAYWRNFVVSNSDGAVVKGVAWGPTVQSQWCKNVTVEFHNVSVRVKENRIQFDGATVLVFRNKYDLTAALPTSYRPLQW